MPPRGRGPGTAIGRARARPVPEASWPAEGPLKDVQAVAVPCPDLLPPDRALPASKTILPGGRGWPGDGPTRPATRDPSLNIPLGHCSRPGANAVRRAPLFGLLGKCVGITENGGGGPNALIQISFNLDIHEGCAGPRPSGLHVDAAPSTRLSRHTPAGRAGSPRQLDLRRRCRHRPGPGVGCGSYPLADCRWDRAASFRPLRRIVAVVVPALRVV